VERLVVAESLGAQRLERAGIPPERLVERATRLLEAAPGFVPAGRAGGASRRFVGQLIVQRADVLAIGPGGDAVVNVALTVELSSRDGEPSMRETGRAAEPVGQGADALRPALERAAAAALERAVGAFALQLAAERKSTAELVKDLAAKDSAVRDHAVRVLADRNAREAVPELIERLRDTDPEVVERAVGALAQLRDPRAAAPLIELARHRDGPYVAQLAHLLGDLGGPDARAWLGTMAAGHPDEVVRGAAREALSSLEAREGQARASPR
jgi:hypothetical protein